MRHVKSHKKGGEIMADEPKAKIEPEKETPDESMPDSEKQTPEPDDDEQGVSDSSPEEGLPDSAKERTRNEFDKLRGQLREERTRREYYETVFNQQLQTKQQDDTAQVPVYDPETGLINEQALTDTQRRAQAAEQKAAEAEKTLKSFVQGQENKEAYTAYPELNPDNEKFDKNLHVATRRILTDAMLNPADYGKELSFKEAADLAKEAIDTNLEQARKQGAKDAVEQLTPKEQAALEAVGTPGRRSQAGSRMSELQNRTRRGDDTAVIERLKRIESQE